MRVEIEREIATRRWKVWVINEAGARFAVMNAAGKWEDMTAPPGSPLPEPTWVIDDEVWIPLTAAILGLPIDQAPLADYLADARQVRDRLLSMVEQRWAPRQGS